MKLSPNFTLTELTKSSVAERFNLDNTPSQEVINNLARVCGQILEPVRTHFGKGFIPNSGYRSPAVNEKAGGSKTSQHMTGEAVDFEIPGIDNYQLACWCRDNLTYDQIILEFYQPGVPDSGWVHVSIKSAGNRGNCITINKAGTQAGLVA